MTKDLREKIGQMDLCGCGQPERWLRVVKAALESLEKVPDDPNWEKRWAKIKPRLETDEGWFIYYVLDSWCLIEHGSSLPGWLTELGEELLMLLREIDCDRDKWAARCEE